MLFFYALFRSRNSSVETRKKSLADRKQTRRALKFQFFWSRQFQNSARKQKIIRSLVDSIDRLTQFFPFLFRFDFLRLFSGLDWQSVSNLERNADKRKREKIRQKKRHFRFGKQSYLKSTSTSCILCSHKSSTANSTVSCCRRGRCVPLFLVNKLTLSTNRSDDAQKRIHRIRLLIQLVEYGNALFPFVTNTNDGRQQRRGCDHLSSFGINFYRFFFVYFLVVAAIEKYCSRHQIHKQNNISRVRSFVWHLCEWLRVHAADKSCQCQRMRSRNVLRKSPFIKSLNVQNNVASLTWLIPVIFFLFRMEFGVSRAEEEASTDQRTKQTDNSKKNKTTTISIREARKWMSPFCASGSG